MDKKDIAYMAAALAIILVVAVIVKPMMTGHPVNTGITVVTTTIPVVPVTSVPVQVTITPVVTPPTAAPTPKKPFSVQTISFVNPASYGINVTQNVPQGTRIDTVPVNNSRTIIAKISGSASGTTQVFNIPYPYWELVYTVDPATQPATGSVQITPTQGSGVSSSGIQGSYSTALPQFTVQVMDAQDPNRVVRTITPPGGINLNLWMCVSGTPNAATTFSSTRQKLPSNVPCVDPRPWTEQFFEGNRSYFFVIQEQGLTSYSMNIEVPSTYIGKY